MGADEMDSTAQEINEKRESTRNPAEIRIICQPYSSASDIRQCTGLLRNYSDNGIYIETPHDYKPGTILIIRITHCTRHSSLVSLGKGVRTICLAQVKWQQDLSDHSTTCYGMGLGYLS